LRLVQHYNDLTEVNGLRCHGRGPAGEVLDALGSLQLLEKEIKTYIAFTDVKATNYPASKVLMDAAGWTVAKKTLDWHFWHGGDAEVNLYYKLFPNNKSDIKDKRVRAGGIYPDHRSLAGSCSMGLIDNLTKDWLQSPSYPERYLTLIRLDRKRTQEEVAKMKYFRYTKVFESDVARYFANGWKPEEWIQRDGEKNKFWNIDVKAPKLDGFVYKPA